MASMNREFNRFKGIAIAVILLFAFFYLLISCRSGGKRQPVSSEINGSSERIEDTAVLYLEVPIFSELSLNDRIAAYLLSQAVLTSRDIPFDQLHPRHLEIITFLEDISRNISYGAADYFAEPFWSYLKMIWIHNGFYDLKTLKKLIPSISEKELNSLMYIALSNSGGKLGTITDINFKRTWMIDHLLNPVVDPVLFIRESGITKDVLKNSVTNFYSGLSADEARVFPAKYPRNSQLTRKGDRVVELVYRIGDENLAPGPYARYLEEVVEFLEKARPYLSQNQVESVDHLIEYLITGDLHLYQLAVDKASNSDDAVEWILGFNDQRFDPLGQKGLWTGMLYISDRTVQEKLDALLPVVLRMLKTYPGYNQKLFTRQPDGIKSVQLLTAIGNNGPLCPDLYFDPPIVGNDEESQRTLIFTNVISARVKARAQELEAKLCMNSAERDDCLQSAEEIAFIRTAIKALISAPLLEKNTASIMDNPYRRILRAALEELAYLWMIQKPEIYNSGILSITRSGDEVFQQFLRRYLLTFVGESSNLTDEQKALQLIGNSLWKSGNCVEFTISDTTLDYRITNQSLMTEEIGKLAMKVSELLLSGNESQVSQFCHKKLSITEQEKLAAVVKRILGKSSFQKEAFILPDLRAEMNPMGGIKDVIVERQPSLREQMFYYRTLSPLP